MSGSGSGSATGGVTRPTDGATRPTDGVAAQPATAAQPGGEAGTGPEGGCPPLPDPSGWRIPRQPGPQRWGFESPPVAGDGTRTANGAGRLVVDLGRALRPGRPSIGAATAPPDPGAAAGAPGAGPGRVRTRHFVRLKLRIMRNGLRGRPWHLARFVIGVVVGLWLAALGFFALAAPGLAGHDDLCAALPALAGTALSLGWLLLPLVFFVVDETLDPARFALLPLPRRRLITGLLGAALVGVVPLSVLAGSGGLVLGAAVHDGAAAAVAQAVGVVCGLVLGVVLSRAVTSGFATMLRSRRVRDLAVIGLASLAALLGPLQLAVLAAAEEADFARLAGVARVLAWTPLAAPYCLGTDVAEGRYWAAGAKLVITAITVAGLLWWWSASLESAMVGTAGGAARQVRAARGGPSTQLFPAVLRWLPRGRDGALISLHARYWWRDARRRANLITVAVVGVFVPVVVNLGGPRADRAGHGPSLPLLLSVIFIGVVAAVTLANQFGFDGSAYAAQLVVGVPGRVELRARALAFALYLVPLLTCVGTVVVTILGAPGRLPAVLGGLYAAFGTGLAVNQFVSVFGAYALPETGNPFAMSNGGGVAKSLLSFLAMVATLAATVPFTVTAALLSGAGPLGWLILPVGVGYGVGAAALGCHLAGDVLDRRAPELLSAVSAQR